jgi:hypothetical protein
VPSEALEDYKSICMAYSLARQVVHEKKREARAPRVGPMGHFLEEASGASALFPVHLKKASYAR